MPNKFISNGQLEVNTTTGALLPPRMTTAQRDALTASAGMLVFNTDTDMMNVYDGTAWVPVGASYERRYASAGGYGYCGTAQSGSSEASNVWTITRLAVADDGSVTITCASNVNWTNYATHSYSSC